MVNMEAVFEPNPPLHTCRMREMDNGNEGLKIVCTGKRQTWSWRNS
jgi:hypothetical protein